MSMKMRSQASLSIAWRASSRFAASDTSTLTRVSRMDRKTRRALRWSSTIRTFIDSPACVQLAVGVTGVRDIEYEGGSSFGPPHSDGPSEISDQLLHHRQSQAGAITLGGGPGREEGTLESRRDSRARVPNLNRNRLRCLRRQHPQLACWRRCLASVAEQIGEDLYQRVEVSYDLHARRYLDEHLYPFLRDEIADQAQCPSQRSEERGHRTLWFADLASSQRRQHALEAPNLLLADLDIAPVDWSLAAHLDQQVPEEIQGIGDLVSHLGAEQPDGQPLFVPSRRDGKPARALDLCPHLGIVQRDGAQVRDGVDEHQVLVGVQGTILARGNPEDASQLTEGPHGNQQISPPGRAWQPHLLATHEARSALLRTILQ